MSGSHFGDELKTQRSILAIRLAPLYVSLASLPLVDHPTPLLLVAAVQVRSDWETEDAEETIEEDKCRCGSRRGERRCWKPINGYSIVAYS